MKKILIAICVTFLLAAPIQMASVKKSNTSEETLVKPNSIEQALNNLPYKNMLMSNKGTADNNDLEVLSKQDQDDVTSTKATQTEVKVAPTKSQTEDRVAVAKITPPTQTENKVTATKSTPPQQTEEKVTATKPTPPQQTEEKVTATKPTTPQQTEDKETSTQPSTPPVQTPPVQAPTTSTSDVSAFEKQVVELTNAERTKAGLAPLQVDTKLMAAAREKSQDMQTNNYFSHTSPTFGSPFDRLTALGISYTAAGENIAQGQRTPQEVVQGWMNSSGHRANILSANFTHIGVGYVKTGNYWTQQFIKK
ncbi:CAP domain-containing protein [Lysinibacillus sp. NPDC096418]|uniref:CAP domain-containing protein n=1 Tax=Lysinibacillus sp. NPDC096418 TaxID=3364138 RepID=UPI0037F376E9